MTVTCGVSAPNLPAPGGGFEFSEPSSLDVVTKLLAERGPEAVVVAGGTDLLRNIRLGLARPAMVISLARIDGLTGITLKKDGGLRIGALTTMAELASDERIAAKAPALAEAAAQVGSPQVRNRATMGGNLCNASPCADSAPPAYVFDALVELRSESGSRSIPLADFVTGPGETVRRPAEVLVAIDLAPAGEYAGSAYETLTRRKALEITIASATARLSLASPQGEVECARVCLGSVAPTPLLSPGAKRELEGKNPTPQVLQSAARAAASDASPIDDLRAGADYRRMMVEVLTQRALTRALERAQGGASQ